MHKFRKYVHTVKQNTSECAGLWELQQNSEDYDSGL